MASDPILTADKVAARIQDALYVPCPTHRMRDCSPLLNGCWWPSTMNTQAETVVAVVLPTVEEVEALRTSVNWWQGEFDKAQVEVEALRAELDTLRDGIKLWAEAKYPNRRGRAVTMSESDAWLIALLGEADRG